MLAGLAALACYIPVPASAQSRPAPMQAPHIDIAAFVREASQRFGIPEQWIHAVIRIESAGRIGAVSSAGAMGLMQLMPGTWARQRDRFALGHDPFDPRDNILAGTSYLREMHDRYGTQGFLAAYNAGPGRYEDWLYRGRSLPPETRRYVARMATLVQPARIFAAAERQSAALPPTTENATTRNPPPSLFARAGQAEHDLFVPVMTIEDR